MKRMLLCVIGAAFIFGCASNEPAPVDDEWQKALADYQGQCADIAFADTKAKVDEANDLKSADKSKEATDALIEAKQLFDTDVAKYNDIKGSADKADSEMTAQKSRLNNIDDDAKKYALKEYTDAKPRIDEKHAEAAEKIEACDGEGAMASLDESNKEITYIEDLLKERMQPASPATDDEIYTVKKGDCLWIIAANKYSNPYFWPLIYWANQDVIKRGPDLIYPNQQFKIDRNFDNEKKAEAERRARTRGPWSLFDSKF